MRSSLIRLAALVTGATLLLASMPATAGARTAAGDRGDTYCSALGAFYEATISVQIAVELGEAFSEGAGDAFDADEVRAGLLILLSPKLEEVSKQLSKGGERALNRAFRRQRKVFARGVQLLRQTGVTDEQIDELRDVEVSEASDDLDELLGDSGVTEDDVAAAARKFKPELEKLTIGVDQEVTDAFEQAATECGVVSSPIDCTTVFPQTDAEAILGVTTSQDGSACDYEAVEGDGDAPEAAVEVYESGRAFDALTKNVEPETVEGIGDEAVSFEGFSAYFSGKTCGRTLVVREGDRTVVVALCLVDEAPVSNDQLAQVADAVLMRLEG
jgi:hypothetical protein